MKRPLATTGQVLVSGRDVTVVIEPRVLALDVAAEVYGISADQIAKLQNDHGAPVLFVGRRRLVPVARFDAWLDAQVQERGAA